MLRSEINTLEKFAEHFIAFAEQSAAYCTASVEFSRALGDMRARVSLEPLDKVQFANATPLFQFWRSLDTSLSTFDLPALTYQEASVIHVDALAAARAAIAARGLGE